MKIRSKLILLSAIFIIGIFSVIGLAARTWQRMEHVNGFIEKGIDLQVKSRDVQSLMKDMVFDLFVPKVYGQLKSFTYSPRSFVTLRQWKSSVDSYKSSFYEFMAAREVLNISEQELLDQFDTAYTMHVRAMVRLEKIDASVSMIKEQLGQLDDESRFNEILGEDTFIPFFEDFRDTSYYFVSSFESFMNYFISEFRENGVRLRREIFIMFFTLAALIAVVGLVLSLIISRDFIWKLEHVEEAFRRVSRGDFSARMNIASNDEFGYLSKQFNELTSDLKQNLENIFNLTRTVGKSIAEDISLHDLLAIVVNAIIQESTADGAAVLLPDAKAVVPGGGSLVIEAAGGSLARDRTGAQESESTQESAGESEKGEDFLTLASEVFTTGNVRILGAEDLAAAGISGDRFSSLLAVPLFIGKEPAGVMIIVKNAENPPFTDLGIMRLTTFNDYAALTLDNYFKYAELIGKGEAEYQALQSQVQPHFIYNVLNGFIGLNRIGAVKDLESAILSLKEMLRYTQDSRTWSTIKEEFGFVETYCKLQKLRFEERLSYKLNMDPEISNVLIPRLLLQPLVENAVIHGLELKQGGDVGQLDIAAFYTLENGKRKVTIVIADNGVGFELETLSEKEHIGLGNVRKRLKYAFPNALLTIKSSSGLGTEVRISINENYSG